MAVPPEGLPAWAAPSLVARSGQDGRLEPGRHRGVGRGARRATARTSHRLTGVPVLPGPATAFLLLVGSVRRWWREASARRARAQAIRRADPYRPGLRWTVLCLACAAGTALGSFLLAGPVTALTGHDLEIPAAAATGQQPTWLAPTGPIAPRQLPAGEPIAQLMAPSGASTTSEAGITRARPVEDIPPPQLPATAAAPVTAAPPAPADVPAAPPPIESGTTPRRTMPPADAPAEGPTTTAPTTAAPTATPMRTTPRTVPTTTTPPAQCIGVRVGTLLDACFAGAALPSTPDRKERADQLHPTPEPGDHPAAPRPRGPDT